MGFILKTQEKKGSAYLFYRLHKRKPSLNILVKTDLTVDIETWVKANKSAASKDRFRRNQGKDLLEKLDLIEKSVLDALDNGIYINGEMVNIIEGDKANNIKVVREAMRVVTNKELLQRKKEYRNEVKVASSPNDNTFVGFCSRYIEECENGDRMKHLKTAQKISASYIKNLKGFRNQALAYQKKNHIVLSFDDITMDFYRKFTRFFLDKHYSPNTIARHMRDLKTIMRAALDLKLTDNREFLNRDFSANGEEVDNVVLSEEQLNQLYHLDIRTYQQTVDILDTLDIDKEERGSLQHALKRELYRNSLMDARDIFLVGCLTGQRVSDYKRINMGMVERLDDGNLFIHLQQQKTKKDIYIPMDERVNAILKKHGGSLPKIYDQHLNERIKVCGLLCGWIYDSGIKEHRGTMTYKTGKRFCDCIMTHTARRTFATNAYRKKISLGAIMKITGHSSEAQLRNYLKLKDKEKAQEAATEFFAAGVLRKAK